MVGQAEHRPASQDPADQVEALGIVDWEGLKHDGIDKCEDRGSRTDAKRQRQYDYRGKRRALAQDPDGVACILPERLEEDAHLHLADLFLDLFDAARGEKCRAAGVGGGHAGADVFVRQHVDEAGHLRVEIAFDAALEHGVGSIVVAGGAGGRLDHFLANVALLAAPRFAALTVEMLTNDGRVRVIRGGDPPLPIGGSPGDLVSLIPVGGAAQGITTTGLEYPLRDEELPLGTSRGVSNVIVAPAATVELATGVLLVVQPFGGSA